MLACVVISLIAGYSYFVPANAVGLIGNYLGLIAIIILYLFLKFYTKSKVIPISEIDIDTGRADYQTFQKGDDDSDRVIEGPWWKRAMKKILYIIT